LRGKCSMATLRVCPTLDKVRRHRWRSACRSTANVHHWAQSGGQLLMLRLRLGARMSSRKRTSIAVAAIALTLVAVAGGSQLGEPAAGRDGPGRRFLDSGLVPASVQPVGLETFPTARRAGSGNRPRPPSGAMALGAMAALATLMLLWCLLRLERAAPLSFSRMGWALAPRAPPVSRLL
jgi:hypothetical protein